MIATVALLVTLDLQHISRAPIRPYCIQYALFPCVQVISTQTLVDPSQVASFACNSLVTSLVESNLLLSRIQVLYTPVLTRELTHKSTRLFDEWMNAD
jgi:hypothetical protein